MTQIKLHRLNNKLKAPINTFEERLTLKIIKKYIYFYQLALTVFSNCSRAESPTLAALFKASSIDC